MAASKPDVCSNCSTNIASFAIFWGGKKVLASKICGKSSSAEAHFYLFLSTLTKSVSLHKETLKGKCFFLAWIFIGGEEMLFFFRVSDVHVLLIFQSVRWWSALMRLVQTASISRTTDWSCTTRRTMRIMEDSDVCLYDNDTHVHTSKHTSFPSVCAELPFIGLVFSFSDDWMGNCLLQIFDFNGY